ncbi:hypothetical protein GGI43DRAFT_419296 [Trichoderma evansii]
MEGDSVVTACTPSGTPMQELLRPRHPDSRSNRTSTACHVCRDKKVKCSGNWPCSYCSKRGLECEFATTSKRRLYSVSHVRELEQKVARYESGVAQGGSRSRVDEQERSSPDISMTSTPSASVIEGVNTTSIRPQAAMRPEDAPTGALGPDAQRTTPRSLAPGTSLSSSDTFSSELRTLLIARSQPNLDPALRTSQNAASPAVSVPQQGFEMIKHWPTEEDAYTMLDIVVLNVGISQQLFDVRTFSDNLSALYDGPSRNSGVPELWIAECLLVFAIARLLQARWDDTLKIPGQEFFDEATKRLPNLGGLRDHQVLGIELMGLCALYLQVSDQKDTAYLYASMALRLSMSHGLHRSLASRRLRRSELVHQNRLWWSVYMQERRLAAAVGFPVAISDAVITAEQPSDYAGYPAAIAIAVNVKLARITGQITATIYSRNNDAEASFIKDVQNILHSLHQVESTMPPEIAGGIHPSELLLRETLLTSSQLSSARTSASLYLTVYQTVIYAVRPILLYMARSSGSDHNDSYQTMSPTLRRLADICVEAARKSLVILQGLRKQGIIPKHAFLDLDCIFSAGFIFVLAVAVNSARGQAYDGIDSARSLLKYLANLGNRAAAKRLVEIDQMCAHLALPMETPNMEEIQPVVLMQPFSFERATQATRRQSDVAGGTQAQDTSGEMPILESGTVGQDALTTSVSDLADIVLEGEEDLYWMYHNPSLSLTGVDLLDWETFENQSSGWIR